MHDHRPTIEIDGVVLKLQLKRKAVRHINARLVDDELRVSAPPSIPECELDEIITRLATRLVRRARASVLNSDDRALKLARRIADRFPKKPTINDVRWSTGQKARWGSYSQRSGIIRLHASLGTLPAWVLEAVIAHELTHAIHPNHSPEFWKLLRKVCPSCDRARIFLEGVTWIAKRWDDLPPVERALFAER